MLRYTLTALLAASFVLGCGSTSKPQAPKSTEDDDQDDKDDDGDDDGDDEAGRLSGNASGAATSTDVGTGTGTGVQVADGGTVTATATGVATGVDLANGVAARVAVNGVRNDDPSEGYQLELTRVGGTASAVTLPLSGAASGIDAQCNDGGETHFTVAILGDGRRYTSGSEGCFVAVADPAGGVHLGFEEDCGEASWHEVDDTIVKLQCPNSRVVLDGIALQSGVSMTDWLD